MKKLTQEQINKILEGHKHWISEDCEGWENMRADFSYCDLCDANLCDANLRGADLSYVNLCDANLSYANLCDTNLSYANLCYANLCDANLSGAYLSDANLRGANLRGTNLSYANLSYANLSGTYLCYANLHGAYLCDANLSYANLRGVNLRDADLSGANLSANLSGANLSYAKEVPYIPIVCPEEGDFIGWKKAGDNRGNKVIVKLHIPSDAKRSSATTRKCRCNKAEVIEIYNIDGTEAGETTCHSDYDNSFIYEVGKTVEVTDFSEDRWEECTRGIHFFINRQEAINY